MLKKVRKIIRTPSRTTMISVGTIVPKDWQYYYIKEIKQEGKDEITITIKKVKVNGDTNEQ